jgi:hypothetical protein
MLRLRLLEASLVAAAVNFWPSSNYADDFSARSDDFSARLSGFNELGTLNAQTGAVLSDGSGTVKLVLDKKAGTIAYTLTYSNVGTTSPQTGMVSQAHIHFGKARDSGGILVYFCTNLSFTGHTGPTPPVCPANSGTVTGTWMAQNVQAIPTQNVNAMDFDALVDALESNTAYANVHTVPVPGSPSTITAFPAGEIRGQCRHEDREHQDNR